MDLKIPAAAVILVIVSVIGIGIMTDIIENNGSENELQYGEYLKSDDFTVISGPIEKSTDAAGNIYIHAVGTGQYKYESNGRTYTGYVMPADVDVIFITGQSNSAYVGVDHDAAEPKPEKGTAFFFGHKNGNYNPSSEPLQILPVTDVNGKTLTGDKCPAMCAEYTKKTGHKVLFVCTGIGGAAIATFNPNGGSTWDYTKTVIQDVQEKAADNFNLTWTTSYCWVQGEADCNRSVEYYKENFMIFHNAMLNGEAGIKFDRCLNCELSLRFGNNVCMADKQLAKEHPETFINAADASYFTVENGLMYNVPVERPVHFSQAGDDIVGVEFSKAIASFEDLETGDKDITKTILQIIPIIIAVEVVAAIVYMIYRH